MLTKRAFTNKRNVDNGGGNSKAGLAGGVGTPSMLKRFVAMRAPDAIKNAGGLVMPTYSVSADKSTVEEGSSVVFTVSTANVPAGTKLYWAIVSSTLSDFVGGISGEVVTDSNGRAIFSTAIVSDLVTEPNRTFTVTVRTGSPAGSIVATSSVITITDPIPTYTITSSPGSSVDEGTSIVFTVTTTNVPNGTFYWKNVGSTSASQFSDGVNQGSFSITNGTGTITRTLLLDSVYNANQTIRIQILKNSTDTTALVESSTISVVDKSVTYSLAVVGGGTTVNEGGSLTFRATTTNVANGTKLYWDISSATVTAADVSPGISGEVTINAGQGEFTLTVLPDAIVEPSDKFIVRLKTSPTGNTVVATAPEISIVEVVPTYSVTQSVTGNAAEGTSIIFTVTTTNVANGTTLYWKNTGTTVAADFTDGLSEGSFTINNNSSTITRTLKLDGVTEGLETVVLDIMTGSTNGPVKVTSGSVGVNNVIATLIIMASKTSVAEGESVNFTITGSNVDANSKIEWDISGSSSSVTAADFVGGISGEATFLSGNQVVVTVTPVVDGTTETESFVLRVKYGSATALSPSVAITDPTVPSPTYSVTSSASGNIANEGTSIVFTINTTNVPDNTILYWKNTGTTTESDFTDNSNNGSFVIVDNSGVVTRSLLLDTVQSEAETVVFGIYESIASSVSLAPLITVYIVNVNQSYSITPSSQSVTEGNSVGFAISTTNVPSGTVLYWDISSASMTADDFSGNVVNGTATIGSNGQATITVSIANDTVVEANDSFILLVRTDNASGPVAVSSSSISVSNPAPTYNITVTPQSNVDEGMTLTYIVTTTNVANGTTLYWSTSGTVDAADFVSNDISGSFTIQNNSGTIIREIYLDLINESSESIRLFIRTGSVTGSIVATSPLINIANVSQPSTSVAVSSDKSTVKEGDQIGYVISTTGVASGTVLTWDISSVSTTSADFRSISGEVIVGTSGKAYTALYPLIDGVAESDSIQLNIKSGVSVLATSNTVQISDTVAGLYAVGGYKGTGYLLNTVEKFNGTSWTTDASMNVARYGLGLAVYNGALYAVGGHSGTGYSNTVEKFNGTSWTTDASMNVARQQLGLAVYNGALYAVGGYKGTDYLNTVEKFDGTSWTTDASMNTARYGLGLAVYNGALYAVGGETAGAGYYINTVEKFDGTSWTTDASMNTARYGLGLAVFNGALYAVGGVGGVGGTTLNTEKFNGTTWTIEASMNGARYDLGLAVY
jgi:hypothetical protein